MARLSRLYLGLISSAILVTTVSLYSLVVNNKAQEQTKVLVCEPKTLETSDTPASVDPISVISDYSEKEETLVVGKGDTMMSLLLKLGLRKEQAHDIIEVLRKAHDPRELRVGQEISVKYSKNSEDTISLKELGYKPSQDFEISLTQDEKGDYNAKKIIIELKKIQKCVEGQIRSSFYSSALRLGIPAAIVKEAISALSFDVNWQHDPQSGDKFTFVFDAYVDKEGKIVKTGELKYVAFSPNGTEKKIYRFQPVNGVAGYYNAQGQSVVKTLLQTPMDPTKMRVTSKFGIRHHPILGYSKQHKGVDFAAPTGTPVMAAGDGVVLKAGYNGAYGNYVLVKHNSDYCTAYAHLSKINVKVGSRVSQRQVIGAVGTTGRSTGPHLHFEVIYKGVHVNPQGKEVKQMPCASLSGKDMAKFQQIKAEIVKTINTPFPSEQYASVSMPVAG